MEALRIFDSPADVNLPMVPIYLDDIQYDTRSVFAGELLAVEEFNRGHALRKLTRFNKLR